MATAFLATRSQWPKVYRSLDSIDWPQSRTTARYVASSSATFPPTCTRSTRASSRRNSRYAAFSSRSAFWLRPIAW